LDSSHLNQPLPSCPTRRPSDLNNPERLAGRYQNKPSYIPAPKRPSVKQPDKLERARREEQERKQQEIEKKKRDVEQKPQATFNPDRKSTRLNSSHVKISYAVFC